MKRNIINKINRRSILPSLFIFAIGLLLTSNNYAQEQKPETKPEVKVETPKIIMAEFYADWCANCKELMPKMIEIRKSFQNKQILVVRFDMTDDYTKSQASFMASYSGLEEAYRKAAGRTGLIALIDAKSKQIYGVISKTKTPEEITKMIDEAINKAETAK